MYYVYGIGLESDIDDYGEDQWGEEEEREFQEIEKGFKRGINILVKCKCE